MRRLSAAAGIFWIVFAHLLLLGNMPMRNLLELLGLLLILRYMVLLLSLQVS